MDSEILRHRLETIKLQAEELKKSPSDSDAHITKITDNVEAILAEIDQFDIDDEFLF